MPELYSPPENYRPPEYIPPSPEVMKEMTDRLDAAVNRLAHATEEADLFYAMSDLTTASDPYEVSMSPEQSQTTRDAIRRMGYVSLEEYRENSDFNEERKLIADLGLNRHDLLGHPTIGREIAGNVLSSIEKGESPYIAGAELAYGHAAALTEQQRNAPPFRQTPPSV